MLNEAIKEAGGDHSAIIEVQEDKAPLFNPALLTFPESWQKDKHCDPHFAFISC